VTVLVYVGFYVIVFVSAGLAGSSVRSDATIEADPRVIRPSGISDQWQRQSPIGGSGCDVSGSGCLASMFSHHVKLHCMPPFVYPDVVFCLMCLKSCMNVQYVCNFAARLFKAQYSSTCSGFLIQYHGRLSPRTAGLAGDGRKEL
jgi:hypothetical protein